MRPNHRLGAKTDVALSLIRCPYGAHRIPTGEGLTAVRRFPPIPEVNRTDRDITVRRFPLVGNPQNDEEWRDYLFSAEVNNQASGV